MPGTSRLVEAFFFRELAVALEVFEESEDAHGSEGGGEVGALGELFNRSLFAEEEESGDAGEERHWNEPEKHGG